MPTRLLHGLLVPDYNLGEKHRAGKIRTTTIITIIVSGRNKVVEESDGSDQSEDYINNKEQLVNESETSSFPLLTLEGKQSTPQSNVNKISNPASQPFSRDTSQSWLNWLASKSKLTKQTPTAASRLRSNEKGDPFQELLEDKFTIPGNLIL